MNEIITVNYDNEQPTVSARELHDFLEVGADFRHWFPRMCEYGFEQGRDFNPVKFDRLQYEGNREVRRTVDDAAITIDMAKELCMLQRNDKGKQARQYFLQLERDWNSPEKVMARALQIANKRIHTLSEKIEQDAPKVLFADSVATAKTSILQRSSSRTALTWAASACLRGCVRTAILYAVRAPITICRHSEAWS